MTEKSLTVNQRCIGHRDEYVGDLYLDGIWYEDEDGKRAWQIAVGAHGVDRSFWVSGEEFRTVGGKISVHESIYMIGNTASDLGPAQRKTILETIARWESQPKPKQRLENHVNPKCIRLG